MESFIPIHQLCQKTRFGQMGRLTSTLASDKLASHKRLLRSKGVLGISEFRGNALEFTEIGNRVQTLVATTFTKTLP
jgi:hypothetical protein